MKTNEVSDIHPLIASRWSPRAFSSQLPDKTMVYRLLTAAGMAPSAFNDQPWAFIVGFRGDNSWQKILNILVEGNQSWAKEAPVLILSVGRMVSANDPARSNASWMYDVGQSVAYLTFQASHEGLWVHQMAGILAEKAAADFELPEHWRVLTAIAVGYMGDKASLPHDLAAIENGPKKRKEFATFVFSSKFGNAVK